MTYITLVCASGMSTSMLMQKMKEAAIQKGLDVELRAMAESKFASFDGPTDIVLLGPQVGYLEDEFRNTYEPKGLKIAVINMVDYGMMNGVKVLDEALALL